MSANGVATYEVCGLSGSHAVQVTFATGMVRVVHGWWANEIGIYGKYARKQVFIPWTCIAQLEQEEV